MIRVEAADVHGIVICVTCNLEGRWNRGFDAGHFLASRRQSILFEEKGVHPQCKLCNGGNTHMNRFAGSLKKEEVTIAYTMFMLKHYGQDEIDRQIRLRNQSKTWSIDELRPKRAGYKQRAEIAMKEKGL